MSIGLGGALLGTTRQSDAAELADDVARVSAAWSTGAVRVTRLAPRFLQAGQELPLPLPSRSVHAQAPGCTTVAILATRSVAFSAQFEADREVEHTSPKNSASGLLMLARCGPSRAQLDQVTVRLPAGRATLEFLIAEGPQIAPSLEQILPERQPGPSGTLGEIGYPPEVEPVPARIAQMEQRITASGGRLAPRRILHPRPQGGGALPVLLAPGCHRLVLLPDTSPGHPADLDAELHDGRDRVVVRDRSHATDAMLEVCTGEAASMELFWLSSNRRANATLLQASWPIPSGVPMQWGPRARAAIASSLRKRVAPAINREPMWEATGLPGSTSVAVEIAPDGCYEVATAPVRGELRTLTLAVTAGTESHHDTGGGGYESALVTFCAKGARVANIEIEASGHGLLWVTGLWRAGTLVPGAPEAW